MTMTASALRDRIFELRSTGSTNRETVQVLSLLGETLSESAVNGAYRREARRRGVAVPTRSTTAARRSARTGRRFGVEIEVVGLYPRDAAAAINAAGIRAEDESYGHRTRAYWKVTTDASVNGCEVVSPPLSGPDGFAALATVVAALVAAGGRIDRSCGIHVHHEVTDLTGSEIADLLGVYADHYETMDALVAPSRRNSAQWCYRYRPDELARFQASFRSIGTGQTAMTEIRQHGIGGRPDSRYRVVNVHCYPTYGTVEFRQHQGSLNGEKIAAWIKLGQAMIESVRSTLDLSSLHGADFIAALPLDASTSAYLSTRLDSLV